MVGILGQLLQWAIKGERSGTCVRRNLHNTSGVLGRGHPYRSRQITPFFKTSNFTHVLRPLIFLYKYFLFTCTKLLINCLVSD